MGLKKKKKSWLQTKRVIDADPKKQVEFQHDKGFERIPNEGRSVHQMRSQ